RVLFRSRLVCGRREEALLAHELDQVGERLQQAEGYGAVRAVPVLHAAEQIPLEPRRVGERDHDQVHDHRGLDQGDPPDFPHGAISTVGWRSPAYSSGTRRTPGRSSRLTRARSVIEVPFDRTVTSS